jgi:hypothetical protein
MEATKLLNAAFDGWRTGLFADGKPAEGNGLPEALASLLLKPEGDRSDAEKQTIESDLRKHFNEKVQPGLSEKFPVIKQRDDLRNELAAYRADQLPRVMIMSDAQPRETSILSRGEYLNPLKKWPSPHPLFCRPCQLMRLRTGWDLLNGWFLPSIL